MNLVSALAVPLILAAVGALMLFAKREKSEKYFDAFVAGARDGMSTAVKLLPALTALLCAVSMFNASGAAGLLAEFVTPVCRALGIPPEIVPLLVVRPVSGSASSALAAELFARISPDSFAGRCASVILGSSDTVFYIIAVYFTAAGIKKTRHALPAALAVMAVCVLLSCALVNTLM
jgi:Uncharacterized membrane protein